tara:strand:+ start:641 stop:841 length:201 start_codon:yes stop_codon:yes gene_type:complete
MIEYMHYSLERALKTLAQTAVAVITASQVAGIIEVSWLDVVSVSALAGVVSLLTSVANYKAGSDGK